MELFIVTFYDQNESGNVVHNEVYTTYVSAKRRYNSLERKLNQYSWVSLYESKSVYGRIRCGKCFDTCSSCNGKDDYYHGDDDDF